MKLRTLCNILSCGVLAAPLHAGAVSLNADGVGQALIFPYYTANSESGNAFNTYLSVVNHSSDAKALRSLTDLVVTFPTRQFYAARTTFSPPFTGVAGWAPQCGTSAAAKGEQLMFDSFTREAGRSTAQGCGAGVCPPEPRINVLCASSNVFSPINSAAHMPAGTASAVLGSTAQGLSQVNMSMPFTNGWVRLRAYGGDDQPRLLHAGECDGTDVHGKPHVHGAPGNGAVGTHLRERHARLQRRRLPGQLRRLVSAPVPALHHARQLAHGRPRRERVVGPRAASAIIRR